MAQKRRAGPPGVRLLGGAGDHQHGPRVDLRVAQAGDAMHRAGARHGQQHARHARQEAGRRGRVAGRLLVAEGDEADAGGLQQEASRWLPFQQTKRISMPQPCTHAPLPFDSTHHVLCYTTRMSAPQPHNKYSPGCDEEVPLSQGNARQAARRPC